MKTETKHTPGKWFYRVNEHNQPCVYDEDGFIAICSNRNDARLIAASPRLASAAEALLEVIGHVTGIESQRKEMIAALKEALGQ
jgi:hypothetical protein